MSANIIAFGAQRSGDSHNTCMHVCVCTCMRVYTHEYVTVGVNQGHLGIGIQRGESCPAECSCGLSSRWTCTVPAAGVRASLVCPTGPRVPLQDPHPCCVSQRQGRGAEETKRDFGSWQSWLQSLRHGAVVPHPGTADFSSVRGRGGTVSPFQGRGGVWYDIPTLPAMGAGRGTLHTASHLRMMMVKTIPLLSPPGCPVFKQLKQTLSFMHTTSWCYLQ